MKTINEVLNLGIPVYESIKVTRDELLSIAQDKEILEDNLEALERDFRGRKRFTRGLSFFRFDVNYLDEYVITSSRKDGKPLFLINPFSYFKRIQELLNMCGYNDADKHFDNKELLEKIDERLKLLKGMFNETELKKEFPLLYDYLLDAREFHQEFLDKSISKDPEEVKQSQKDETLYYRFGHLRDQVYDFSVEQADMLSKDVHEYQKLHDMINDMNKVDNTYALQGINPSKLEMLMAYKLIKLAYEKDNVNVYQEVIYYLLPVLMDTDVINESINVDGKDITYYTLYNEYVHLMEEYNLVPLNLPREKFVGKTKKETEDMLKSELETNGIYTVKRKVRKHPSGVSTPRIPKEEKEIKYNVPDSIVPREVDNTKHKVVKSHKASEYTYKRGYEQLKILLLRKQNLLDKSNYVMKYVTQDGYNGYIYFIYDNGIVIREKYYDDYGRLKIADGESLFILDASKFLSNFDKSKDYLIHLPNEEARRIYHGEGYEEIVSGYLNLPATDETREVTKKLIKDINESDNFIEVKKTNNVL